MQPKPLAQPRQILRVYFTISGLYTLSASLIWGVNTLFLLAAGLTIFQVFVVNTFFSVGMMLFEIPTGLLADTRGRRASFLLSTITLAAGTLGYVFGAQPPGNVPVLSLMSIVMGLGFTFYSGAVEAWLVDALKAAGFAGGLDPVFARGGFVSGAAMLAGTVGGGLLGEIHLAIPYVLRAALLLLLFGLAYFSLHDLGYRPRAITLSAVPREMQALARSSLQVGWATPGLRWLMLMGLIQNGFLYWGFYAWPPYFLNLLGREAVWVSGVVAALISLATMAGNAWVERLARLCGKRTTLLLWSAAVSAIALVGVGIVNSFWPAVSLFLVAMAAQGVGTPVRQAYLHQLVASEQRAAITSFDSMLANVGGIVGQTGLGYVAQAGSIAAGYVIGGAATALAVPALFGLRRLRQAADWLTGQTGKPSACAAQGLPAISSLDTLQPNE
ncbi:MAG: MFS transporter [Anaerolineales bacterium]|nr:MFS transporter [Anaerolineales bacterium]